MAGFFRKTGTAMVIAINIVAFPFAFAALADEPVKLAKQKLNELFPNVVDPRSFVKYDVTYDEEIVSTQVQAQSTVKKIGYGKTSIVTIINTPTGTYSTDGLLSPHVRYPGIEVSESHDDDDHWGHHHPRNYMSFGTRTSPWGTSSWTTFSNGSFTFYNSTYKPTRRGG